uniref:Secreted protein n=1 Tax=Anopheles darlingi TaxID=43151 RepID=A0A2M4D6L1_ANODA
MFSVNLFFLLWLSLSLSSYGLGCGGVGMITIRSCASFPVFGYCFAPFFLVFFFFFLRFRFGVVFFLSFLVQYRSLFRRMDAGIVMGKVVREMVLRHCVTAVVLLFIIFIFSLFCF